MNISHLTRVPLLLLCILGAVCLSIFVLFHNLGSHSVSIKSDEVIYVRVTQSAAFEGAWWHLKHGNAPFFEKPPLKIWLSALVLRLFGESNFTFRVLDAVAGLGVIILACLLSVQLFALRPAVLIPALMILSCLEAVTGDHGFRRATLDGLLTLLSAAMMLVCWKIHSCRQARRENRAAFILLGAFAGLAILTKSAGGILPFLCAALSLLALWPARDRKELWRGLAMAALAAALIALPYFAWHMLHSQKAARVMLGIEIIQRVWTGFEGHHRAEPFFYLHYLFRKSGLVPASFLFLALIWGAWAWRREAAVRFLLVWLIVPVAGYSIAASRAPWYLLPALPACAVLTGRALEKSTILLCSFFNGHKPAIRILLSAAVALLLLRGIGEYQRKCSAVLATVLRQKSRISFDLAAERILSEQPAKVLILENIISQRAKPVRGRFNVEGIYLQMLRDRIIDEQELPEAAAKEEKIFVVASSELAGSLPVRTARIMDLPPFGMRKKAAALLELSLK